MSNLRELYQEIIVDHSKQPRNFGVLQEASRSKDGFNPLCGDKLTLHIQETNSVLEKIRFEGCGCAISLASASLMTEAVQGKTFAEIGALFALFHQLVTGQAESLTDQLGKLSVLAGVAEYPVRVKCATLAWHTLMAVLENNSETVSTE